MRMPFILGEPFLGAVGQIGFRCPFCPYVATGRSREAVDAAVRAHSQHVHVDLPAAEPVCDTESS